MTTFLDFENCYQALDRIRRHRCPPNVEIIDLHSMRADAKSYSISKATMYALLYGGSRPIPLDPVLVLEDYIPNLPSSRDDEGKTWHDREPLL